jgi:D-alanine-D-alanine ligase
MQLTCGLTYDLRQDWLAMGYGEEETAEFDSIATIDGLEEVLTGLGYRVERIGHLKNLVGRLAAGARWDFVFNICEGMYGMGREAAVPALLDAYRIPCVFSDPLTLSVTLDKGIAKTLIARAGVPSADFAVLSRAEEARGVSLPFPVFVKPVAEGSGKGISPASRCNDVAALEAEAGRLIAAFRQPVIVETFLPGREFTVGIVGEGETAYAIGVMEVFIPQDGYGYDLKQIWEDFCGYELVDDAEAREAAEVALAGWRVLRCRDGGRVDIRSDAKGRPHFIEVNPLAGLHPTYSDLCFLAGFTGRRYHHLIGEIMAAFWLRHPHLKPVRAQAA